MRYWKIFWIIFARLLYRNLRITVLRTVKISDKRKLRLVLPEQTSEEIYKDFEYESDSTAFMKKVLRKGDIFYEVGAHLGYHSVLAGDLVGPTGQIVAFEPTIEIFKILKQNLDQFIWAKSVNMAVTDGKKQYISFKIFDMDKSSFNTAKTSRTRTVLVGKEMKIKVTSLDKFVFEQHNRPPNLIKVDVENGEVDVLSGSVEIIKMFRPAIIMEVGDINRGKHESTATCLNFLERCGYSFFEYSKGKIVSHKSKSDYNIFGNLLCLYKK